MGLKGSELLVEGFDIWTFSEGTHFWHVKEKCHVEAQDHLGRTQSPQTQSCSFLAFSFSSLGALTLSRFIPLLNSFSPKIKTKNSYVACILKLYHPRGLDALFFAD